MFANNSDTLWLEGRRQARRLAAAGAAVSVARRTVPECTRLAFVNNIGSVAYCPNNHCSPGAGLTSDLTG